MSPNTGFNTATDQSDDWRTPGWLFRALDVEFAFDCDAAADATNTKCASYIDDISGFHLHVDPPQGTRFFCNPPFSGIEPFVKRALAGSALWVFILPVRTRTAWFEELELARATGRAKFRWLRRRIAFDPPPGVAESSPRMDTFVVVVRALPAGPVRRG